MYTVDALEWENDSVTEWQYVTDLAALSRQEGKLERQTLFGICQKTPEGMRNTHCKYILYMYVCMIW